MSANTYLPLAAGLAAPLVVLCLVWATRRAGDRLRERRAERRASRAQSSARKPRPKRALVVAAIASAVAVAAAVALAVSDRQGLGSVMAGSEEATVPTAFTPPPPRPAPRPQNDGRERRKPARVAVANAAGVQGLAARKSRLLRRKGFEVRGTSTAPIQRSESVVFFAKGKARAARSVARALQIRSREPDDQQVDASGQGADVIVVLGTDEAGALPSTRDSSYTSTSTAVDN